MTNVLPTSSCQDKMKEANPRAIPAINLLKNIEQN
jgi:hypothetical protein